MHVAIETSCQLSKVGGGFQRSIRDKRCPAQDFPSPHQALCLAAITQACVDYFVRPLAGKADAHPCWAAAGREEACSTPKAGFHGNKKCRELTESELAGWCLSILCEVLLVKSWDIRSHCYRGGRGVSCTLFFTLRRGAADDLQDAGYSPMTLTHACMTTENFSRA